MGTHPIFESDFDCLTDVQMSFFGFGKSAEVSIALRDIENRRRVPHRVSDRRTEELLLYYDGETISGHIQIDLKLPNLSIRASASRLLARLSCSMTGAIHTI